MVGFTNQETFNVTVAFDDDPDLSEQVAEAVASYPEANALAEELQAILARHLDLVGSGRGRHVLMDLVRFVTFIGSVWRIDWHAVAVHYLQGDK